MELSYKVRTSNERAPLGYYYSRINHYLDMLRRVLHMRSARAIENTSRFLSVNPLAFKGFISVQWNKLPGIGILSTDEVWRNLGDIDELIDIKVNERTAELEDSRQQLEAFGYSVSHDLKAPLRIINGYCAILKNSPELLNGEGPEIVEIISGSAAKMSRLIDDLLKFSKAGSMTLVKKNIDMYTMATAVIAEMKMNAPMPHHIMIHNMPDTRGDSCLVKQVWINLISNAIKYSSKKHKPVIEIGAELRDGEQIYYVRDNGAGFDMRFADKLFQAFRRLHSEEEFEGTGIGLALSQRIVNKHGGRIWAEAEVDKGATFYFTL